MYSEYWGAFVKPFLQWKAITTYSECAFVTLRIQRQMRMDHIVTCVFFGSTNIFSTFHKSTIFEKKTLLNTKCLFWFSLQYLSEKFLILRGRGRIMIRNMYRSSRKIHYRHSGQILMKFEFSWQSFEEYSNIKFHENPQVRAELFHTDWRTDRRTQMTKLIIAFHNFAKAPKAAKKCYFIEIRTG
jgi:hypothetical protein